MSNFLLKKTMSSMLGMDSAQVDAIINAAEAFKSNEIDKGLAIKVFNKMSTKSPRELNEFLRMIDENS